MDKKMMRLAQESPERQIWDWEMTDAQHRKIKDLSSAWNKDLETKQTAHPVPASSLQNAAQSHLFNALSSAVLGDAFYCPVSLTPDTHSLSLYIYLWTAMLQYKKISALKKHPIKMFLKKNE